MFLTENLFFQRNLLGKCVLLQPGIIIAALLFVISGPVQAQPHQVKCQKHGPGQWELLVDGKPYFVKGAVYNFMVIGDDPNNGTLRDWSILDLDHNGKIDVAYDSWVDKNRNNVQDKDESAVGDWQLLKELGANTIRIYQMPSADERLAALYSEPGSKLTFFHPPNKALFRDLYERYGIMVAVGHFFGEWTIGSGATWDKGTDYTDPVQRKNLLTGIRVMVEEHKDEPYTLMWVLGNENFNPYDHDNAETHVPAFLTLVNEAAQLIHQLDPDHPVALCNFHQANLTEIARYAPDIDIFGTNDYRREFQPVYEALKTTFDRPVLITEYGAPSVEADDFDLTVAKNYHQVSWRDIKQNRYGGRGVGNSIGAMIFIFVDQWSLTGSPNTQDHDPAFGMKDVEWYGLISQGDGSKSPYLRQVKKIYSFYQQEWNK